MIRPLLVSEIRCMTKMARFQLKQLKKSSASCCNGKTMTILPRLWESKSILTWLRATQIAEYLSQWLIDFVQCIESQGHSGSRNNSTDIVSPQTVVMQCSRRIARNAMTCHTAEPLKPRIGVEQTRSNGTAQMNSNRWSRRLNVACRQNATRKGLTS